MQLADLRRLGYLPLQHHEPGVDVDLRNVVYAARFTGLDPRGNRTLIQPGTMGDLVGAVAWENEPAKRSWLAAWSFAMPAVVTSVPGPPIGSQQLRSMTRVEFATGARSGNQTKFRPALNRDWAADERFVEKPIGTDRYPVGTRGLVVSAVKEDEQHELFIPGPVPIVAVNKAGDPSVATLVHDLDSKSKLDPARRARLHSSLRVVLPVPGGCGGITPSPEGGSLAWQLTGAGRDGVSGHGLVYDTPAVKEEKKEEEKTQTRIPTGDQANKDAESQHGKVTTTEELIERMNSLAQASDEQRARQQAEGTETSGGVTFTTQLRNREQTTTMLRGNGGGGNDQTQLRGPPVTGAVASATARKGGPLEVGNEKCQHRLGVTADNEPINSLHHSIKALHWDDEKRDGPLDFSEEAYPQVLKLPFKTEVHLGWDPNSTHDWVCGKRKGRWRWWADTFIDLDKGRRPPRVDPPPFQPPPRVEPPPFRPPPPASRTWVAPTPPVSLVPRVQTYRYDHPTYDLLLPNTKKNQEYILTTPVNRAAVPDQPYSVSITPIGTKEMGFRVTSTDPLVRDPGRDYTEINEVQPSLSSLAYDSTKRSTQPLTVSLKGYGNEADGGGWRYQLVTKPTVQGRPTVQGSVMLAPSDYTLGEAQAGKAVTSQRVAYLAVPPSAAGIGFGTPTKRGVIKTGIVLRPKHLPATTNVPVSLYADTISPTSAVTAVNDILVPTGYASGLQYNANGATVTVNPGTAKSYDQSEKITLTTPTTAVLTTASNLDRKTLPGTYATTAASTAVVGTGTTLLGNDLAPKTLTGSITTGGVATKTITGLGTVFTQEVAIGDLIGPLAGPWTRVISVDSDTSLLVDLNVTIVGFSSSNKVVENSRLLILAPSPSQINQVTSNTAATMVTAFAINSSGNVATLGVAAANTWYGVYLLAGTSGTTIKLCTQRTTPFLEAAGFSRAYRRIGFVYATSTSTLRRMGTYGGCSRRTAFYEDTEATLTALSVGTAVAWTSISMENFVPPTEVGVSLTMENSSSSAPGVKDAYIRPRGIPGASAVARGPVRVANVAGTQTPAEISCSGTTGLEYNYEAVPTGGGGLTVVVVGWTEDVC